VSEQAVLTQESEGISATLQERVRAFTAFYEQHAYLAYNLALRITCEGDAAARAVQRAFLGQVESDPPGLLPVTVRAAVEEAPVEPDPSAAGDPESQALMAAAGRLSPAERGALAASELAEAGPEEIGEALGIPADQAANLIERAREAFAAKLGAPRQRADQAARDWMWAAPPNEIWEDLYPLFHRTVERQLRRGDAEHTLVLKGGTAQAPAKVTRRGTRRMRRAGRSAPRGRLRQLPLRIVLPLAAVLLVAAGLAATQLPQVGEESGAPVTDQEAAGLPASDATPGQAATGESSIKPRKPLTAALLDKLRLRELRQLRAYGKRQADTSLPARQRRAAARRIDAIERAARARLRAQERREAAMREREARTRARSQAPPPPPPPSAPAESRPPSRRTESRPRTETTPGAPPRTREEAERNCLQDESTGQFICPQ